MKMKILTLTIAFITLTSSLIGQSANGIWLSTHTLEIGKEHKPYSSDSIYSNASLLLDILDDNTIVFKPIGKIPEHGTYSLINNNIKLNVGEYSYNGSFSNNKLEFTIEDTEEHKIKVFLEKIKQSDLALTQLLDSTSFYNTSWIIKTNPDSQYYGIKYNFLDKDSINSFDKNIVIITKDKGDYGYTENGMYGIDSYKNHFFIEIFNGESLNKSVYHFYKIENNLFFADTYDSYYIYKKPPKLKELKFIKTDYLTIEQLELIKSKLIGKWKAINEPIPFDSNDSKYKRLENQSFELTFKSNNEYELIKKGLLINDNKRVPKKININGNWKISKTGKYIEIKQKEGWIEYITISDLKNDSLKIYFDVKVLEENLYHYRRTLVELNK